MRFIIALLAFANSAYAHEMTPTYFDIKPSFVDGISVIEMSFWNRRQDVTYYEIDVFDSEWNSISFAASNKLLYVEYLNKKNFDIYVKDNDKDDVYYVCTVSKILKSSETSTGIASRICSRVNEGD